jgi:hypothetical protein
MSSNMNPNAPVFYPVGIKKLQKLYEKDVKEFIKYQAKHHNEMEHIIQDRIYRKFIKDVADGEINKIEEIHFISSMIVNKIIIYDKNRWYS